IEAYAKARVDAQPEHERVMLYAAAVDYAEKIQRDYKGTWFGGPSARVQPICLPSYRPTIRPHGTTRAPRPRRRRSTRSRAPTSGDSDPSEPPSQHVGAPRSAAA